jgi:hypothetical protein
MAFRLVNLHPNPLRVELRGGGVLMLAPGARSAALREELLYDNHHVGEWERAGWVRRLPARMSDVATDEAAALQAAAAAQAVQPSAPKKTPARKRAAKKVVARAAARTTAKKPGRR